MLNRVIKSLRLSKPRTGGALAVLLAMAGPLPSQVNVLTYQYDLARSGANLSETILKPANVNTAQFGKLFSYPVDGYVYGQPLYLANVAIPGKGTHNVVYVATEHDSVYAFDADTNSGANAAPLWQVSFINPAAGITTVPASDVDCTQIYPEIGITSTPVIDPARNTLYVVAMTKENIGGAISYAHRLHALDAATGAERPGSPVTVQASAPGRGDGGSTVTLNPKSYKQRPGLLLLNGIVYLGFSSHCDIGTYHGWILGYDAQSLRQVVVFNDTPNGGQGSFWASGAAPAADAEGNIFVVSGNGTFDATSGGPDLGESYIKLSADGGLSVADYFTPFNYSTLNGDDADVGSSGVVLLPDEAGGGDHPHLMVGAGKEGRIYVLDRDNLGKWQAGSDSQIVQSLPRAISSLFGNPAYFNGAVYFCGSGDNLKAFSIVNGSLSTSPVSRSPESFGFPGCVPAISANGKSNGIVWVLDPGGTVCAPGCVSGTLRAYDASNLANELYNSAQYAARDSLGLQVKFSVPTVANGKVYAGTQSALVVYGLLSQAGASLGIANAASAQQNVAAPGSIISVYGSGLAQSTVSATSMPLPTQLGGASVQVGVLPAPMFYASPGQINAQVPFETPIGPATIAVTSGGQFMGAAGITIQPTAPGLFTLGDGRAAAINQDGSLNTASRPAATGSVVSVYLTGLGAVDNAVATGAAASAVPLSWATSLVTATVGDNSAAVIFAGLAPNFAGLYQVNVVVPQLAPGDYPLRITAGGVASNSAIISVQ